MTRQGDWMLTYTGKAFYPMDPNPEDIDPRDIAHALSLLCRYNGHVKKFYSVAEHCVLISYALPQEFSLWGLLHDATEAYVGDMIRPLKSSMPAYRYAEDRVMEAIASRFGLEGKMPDIVKEYDTRMLFTERATLMNLTQGKPWVGENTIEPLPVNVQAWDPSTAEYTYYNTLSYLMHKRGTPLPEEDC